VILIQSLHTPDYTSGKGRLRLAIVLFPEVLLPSLSPLLALLLLVIPNLFTLIRIIGRV